MQATRQNRARVLKRHERRADTSPSMLKIVAGAVLGALMLYAFNVLVLSGGDVSAAAPVNTSVQSQDSIDALAHSLRGESRIQRIEEALK